MPYYICDRKTIPSPYGKGLFFGAPGMDVVSRVKDPNGEDSSSQGDITGMFNKAGAQVVSYTITITQRYDALGRVSGKTVTTDTTNYNTTYGYMAGVNGSTITNNGVGINYTYDTNGNIETITQNGQITKYYYDELNEVRREDNQGPNITLNGDKVTLEDNGTDKIYYTYDAAGNLVSMNLNGTEYYYIRNAQGDITGLFDKAGAQGP